MSIKNKKAQLSFWIIAIIITILAIVWIWNTPSIQSIGGATDKMQECKKETQNLELGQAIDFCQDKICGISQDEFNKSPREVLPTPEQQQCWDKADNLIR